MVQQLVMSLVDDLDGGLADETVQFNLDGTDYEVDLSLRNASLLRQALADYVSSARRTGHARREHRPLPPDSVHRRDDREQNRAIRAWARRRGTDLPARGRIPTQIVHAYHQGD